MQIIITVEKMLCAKPETCWYFFRAMMGNTAMVCKGKMGWTPQVKETLALIGDYVEYKGERQFQFTSAKLTLPLDQRSQLDYVGERANGIGPKTCDEIWRMRGDDWRNLQRGEVRKMSDAAYDSFREQIVFFDQNQEKAEILSWLENKGCSEAMAAAAYERWKNDTAGIVTENCYRLAELAGYSFKTVDENVRRNFDIADDDPRRIKSAVIYAMQQKTDDGSTAVACWSHFDACKKLLPNIGDDLIVQYVQEMIEEHHVYVFGKQGMMSLRRDYGHEEAIYEFVQAASVVQDAIELDFIALAAGEAFTPDETQISAARNAISRKFSIVNGGAGVGKTTIIKMIVRGIRKSYKNLEVKLCAPTGKAAARLKEASGIEASTIHLMLGARGGDIFTAESLDRYAVIVDESSMVDSALLFEIVSRNPAKLVLVGDQAQLTPVGHGQPFHDLINIFPECVNTLNKCYRNTEAVFQAATQIRNGNLPSRSAESENEKWTITGAAKPEQVQELICGWARGGYLDFATDIVLCPKNGVRGENDQYQEATVNALNEALLAIDREKRGQLAIEKWEPGDRVINTVNNPEAQVWNGTTGTIHAVDSEQELYVRLDVPVKGADGMTKDIVKFDKDMIKALRYAYALTVHKAQGSQYRRVVIAVLARDAFSLDRSLVYTGVTRTRSECVVVGDYNALAKSIGQVRKKDTVLQCLMMEDAL